VYGTLEKLLSASLAWLASETSLLRSGDYWSRALGRRRAVCSSLRRRPRFSVRSGQGLVQPLATTGAARRIPPRARGTAAQVQPVKIIEGDYGSHKTFLLSERGSVWWSHCSYGLLLDRLRRSWTR